LVLNIIMFGYLLQKLTQWKFPLTREILKQNLNYKYKMFIGKYIDNRASECYKINLFIINVYCQLYWTRLSF
jgi:hypothetical protein